MPNSKGLIPYDGAAKCKLACHPLPPCWIRLMHLIRLRLDFLVLL